MGAAILGGTNRRSSGELGSSFVSGSVGSGGAHTIGPGRVLINSVHVRFAPEATEILRCREMTRGAKRRSSPKSPSPKLAGAECNGPPRQKAMTCSGQFLVAHTIYFFREPNGFSRPFLPHAPTRSIAFALTNPVHPDRQTSRERRRGHS
jgi:hypothetical protein